MEEYTASESDLENTTEPWNNSSSVIRRKEIKENFTDL